jgi:hypothetical protein
MAYMTDNTETLALINVPTGTYLLQSSLIMASNITIRGEGSTNKLLNFRIQADSDQFFRL